MNEQPGEKNNLIRSYVRYSLLMAVILLALLLPLYLIIPVVFPSATGRALIIVLVLLPVLVGMMMFRHYRSFVWPAQKLLENLIVLSQGKTPLNDSRIPGLWKPWFVILERIFQSFEEKNEEILRQNGFLQQLVRERTAELEMISASLGEEMAERSNTESALQEINQKLQEISLVDGVTGIANHRKFDEYLQQVWRQMVRDHRPVSLILCEIDDFKQFGGTYGHQASDHCLREVARLIQNTLHRPGDLASRYEGGKFLVVLPRTDSQGAIQVAEILQQAIAELEMPHGVLGTDSRFGFTIGLASTFPERESTPKNLLKTAEEALDRARKSGNSRLAI